MTEEERSALQQAIQAQQRAIQAQNMGQYVITTGQTTMAGGGSIGPLTTGSMYASTANSGAYTSIGNAERRAIHREAAYKERNEIVQLIQSMADEVGAPTLLNAVVLAINVRDYPEE